MRKLFVEGGGDYNDALKTECRRGFATLLQQAGFQGRMPRIVACGGRRSVFDQFCTAIGKGSGVDLAILLVDSEAPVGQGDPWQHVAQRLGDGWVRPAGATEDHLHFMVQCMEAWFLADREVLQGFYGQGFKEGALPAMTCVQEDVDKRDLYRQLDQATRTTTTKGVYDKGKHAFKLLAKLDPKRVREANSWADRFFATLDRLLQ